MNLLSASSPTHPSLRCRRDDHCAYPDARLYGIQNDCLCRLRFCRLRIRPVFPDVRKQTCVPDPVPVFRSGLRKVFWGRGPDRFCRRTFRPVISRLPGFSRRSGCGICHRRYDCRYGHRNVPDGKCGLRLPSALPELLLSVSQWLPYPDDFLYLQQEMPEQPVPLYPEMPRLSALLSPLPLQLRELLWKRASLPVRTAHLPEPCFALLLLQTLQPLQLLLLPLPHPFWQLPQPLPHVSVRSPVFSPEHCSPAVSDFHCGSRRADAVCGSAAPWQLKHCRSCRQDGRLWSLLLCPPCSACPSPELPPCRGSAAHRPDDNFSLLYWMRSADGKP